MPVSVASAIAKVGGVVQASAIMRTRQATLYKWRQLGYIPLALPLLRLVAAMPCPPERKYRIARQLATPPES